MGSLKRTTDPTEKMSPPRDVVHEYSYRHFILKYPKPELECNSVVTYGLLKDARDVRPP